MVYSAGQERRRLVAEAESSQLPDAPKAGEREAMQQKDSERERLSAGTQVDSAARVSTAVAAEAGRRTARQAYTVDVKQALRLAMRHSSWAVGLQSG